MQHHSEVDEPRRGAMDNTDRVRAALNRFEQGRPHSPASHPYDAPRHFCHTHRPPRPASLADELPQEFQHSARLRWKTATAAVADAATRAAASTATMIRRRRMRTPSPIDPVAAGDEEATLVVGGLEARVATPDSASSRRPPPYRKLASEPASTQSGRRLEPAPGQQVVEASSTQPGNAPTRDQRLMCQLHGRCRLAGSRSNVSSRWRPYSSSTLSRSSACDADLLQLGAPHPAAGVQVVLAHADEAEEHVPSGLSRARRARRRSPRRAGRSRREAARIPRMRRG